MYIIHDVIYSSRILRSTNTIPHFCPGKILSGNIHSITIMLEYFKIPGLKYGLRTNFSGEIRSKCLRFVKIYSKYIHFEFVQSIIILFVFGQWLASGFHEVNVSKILFLMYFRILIKISNPVL